VSFGDSEIVSGFAAVDRAVGAPCHFMDQLMNTIIVSIHEGLLGISANSAHASSGLSASTDIVALWRWVIVR
jgi:hypothetical protein